MSEQFIWNVNYNTTKIKELIESIEDISLKLYAVPREPLTIEESYKLREALSQINALNEMTVYDLELREARTVKNQIKNFFHRK